MRASRVASQITGDLVKSAGGTQVGNGLGGFLHLCGEKGFGPAMAAVFRLGDLAIAGGILSGVSLIGGPILLDALRKPAGDKRFDRVEARFRELSEQLRQLDERKLERAAIERHLDELFDQDGEVGPALRTADAETLSAIVTERSELVAAAFDHAGAFETLRVYVADNNRWLRWIVDEFKDLKRQIGVIASDYVERIRCEEAKNETLARQIAEVTQERDDLRVQVESALVVRADQEFRKGREIEDVLRELRAGDPTELLQSLGVIIEEDEQELQDLNAAHSEIEAARLAKIAELVQRYRERATIAYPLGEIEIAFSSL